MRLETIAELSRKELSLFFSSPIGYLFLAVYLGVTMFVFFWVEAFFARNIADVRPMFEWLPILLIFLSAALTMRSWSDERRTGTIEFLVTLPSSSWELVVGKFSACVVLLLIALILTLPLPITVAFMGDLDWGPVVAGYIAAVLLGATYLSIGVFVSARCDNQIVSLIVTAFICGVFYVLGSPFLTSLVDNNFAEFLRSLGSGSRFTSITRGVLDFRDLYFYGSIAASFLVLNVFAVKSLGWTDTANEKRHRTQQVLLGLLVVNLLLANVWIGQVKALRWDVTEGDQYSISEITEVQLSQLTEPLLIRGYFSSKTHPLLAPLVPQIKDLLAEYQIVGGDKLRLELVDPAADPEMEDEANSKYGINAVAFQISDRHQASLVNSYFDILVQYGDEFEVLGYSELIEVKAESESALDVKLNNPEYQITRTIKKVVADFRSSSSTFDLVQNPVQFVGYISDDGRLPQQLIDLKPPLTEALNELKADSSGKFTWSFVDPEAGGGETAIKLQEDYGMQPMRASLFDANHFYYYLTMTDGEVLVSLPLPSEVEVDGLKRQVEEGLKRFSTGLLSSVAIHKPDPFSPQMPQMPQMPQQPQGSQFNDLQAFLAGDFDVRAVDLEESIDTNTDLLIVLGPENLTRTELFTIDQYLMRGGAVAIASSAFKIATTDSVNALPIDSGLADWLSHHGVAIQESLALDMRHSAFPLRVRRVVGGLAFNELRVVDYPYFIDIQRNGMAEDSPITNNVSQLTYTWSSPLLIDADKNAERTVVNLIESSDATWTESVPDVMPRLSDETAPLFAPGDELASELLAVSIVGQFNSFFEESPLLEFEEDSVVSESLDVSEENGDGNDDPEEADEDEGIGTVSSVISQSPDSAKLIVFGSTEFLSDQTTRLISSSWGAYYTNAYQMMSNVVDWTVEDASLQTIRGRGHFNRTLPPMADGDQRFWEYGNYVFALLGIFFVFLIDRQLGSVRERRHRAWLGEA